MGFMFRHEKRQNKRNVKKGKIKKDKKSTLLPWSSSLKTKAKISGESCQPLQKGPGDKGGMREIP